MKNIFLQFSLKLSRGLTSCILDGYLTLCLPVGMWFLEPGSELIGTFVVDVELSKLPTMVVHCRSDFLPGMVLDDRLSLLESLPVSRDERDVYLSRLLPSKLRASNLTHGGIQRYLVRTLLNLRRRMHGRRLTLHLRRECGDLGR